MSGYDDDLTRFAAGGAPPLPQAAQEGFVEHDGARIRFAAYGSGPPVALLHGGFGNAENWGNQVPAVVAAGYRAIVVDSRGHGRSTRDARPLSYERMARDVVAVLDALDVAAAALAGWSDGAIVALTVAMRAPLRVRGVFFFAANADLSGVMDVGEPGPLLQRAFARHKSDYARLSPTPGGFASFAAAVDEMMRTQPAYTAGDLAAVRVPVTVVQSVHDEFIRADHAAYVAATIPNAAFVELEEGTHFAPLQRPDAFNRVLLSFLARLV